MNGPIVQLYCKKLNDDNLDPFLAARPDNIGWQINLSKLDGAAALEAAKESARIASRLRDAGVTSVFLLHPSTAIDPMIAVLDIVRPNIFLASAERSHESLLQIKESDLVGSLMVPIGIPIDPSRHRSYDPLAEMHSLEPVADWFTTDTITDQDTPDRFGCSGKTSDWSMLAALVNGSSRPVVAAGGLSATNVADLWKSCKPAGFDAHTSVCTAGQPDIIKAREFTEAVRALS